MREQGVMMELEEYESRGMIIIIIVRLMMCLNCQKNDREER